MHIYVYIIHIHDIYIYVCVCVCGVFMYVYLCFFCMCLCLCISVFFGLFVFLLCVILNQSTSQNHVIKVTSSCINLTANLICATNNSNQQLIQKVQHGLNPSQYYGRGGKGGGGGVKLAKKFKSFWSLGLVKLLFCRGGC